MAPTWREISDAANREPAITTYPQSNGYVDWEAVEHRIAGNDSTTSVQALGWTSPSGSRFAAVGVDAVTFSPAAARQFAAALLSAADDAEAVTV